MTDKRIRIILDTRQAQNSAENLDKEVKEVGKSAEQTQFRMSRLATAIKAALVGGALGKAVATLTQAQREFDKLNAALITATGSAENAASAFSDIEALAANTPFAVDEVTNAFIRLRNLGLDPSEEAIISYGNTASALGKSLTQFIEAVADATTAEFERLKEFGIRARNEGEQIAFTFQGVTERVGNNAEEIQGFLRRLGDENFAGALSERVNTLDGAISNLGDSWSALVRAVNRAGAGDAIQDAVRLAITAIRELESAIASGQLPSLVAAWAQSFQGFAEDFTSLANGVASVYNGLAQQIQTDSGSISGFLSDAFTDAGPNIRAFVQLMTVEVAGAIERVVALADFLNTSISDFSFSEASQQLERDLIRINSVREDSIDLILQEAEAAKVATSEQIEAARQLRLEFDQSRGARSGGGLGQFAVQGGESSGASASDSQKGDAFEQRLASQTASLQRELELRSNISAIYRQGEIDAQSSQFEQERAQQKIQEQTRLAELQAKAEEDKARRQEQFLLGLERLTLEDEERKALQDQFDQNEIAARLIVQEQITEIERSGAKDREAIAKAEAAARISTWSNLASSGLQILNSFGNQSFQSQKNFAIAEGIVNIASGVAKALNNPYPANLAFAAQVAIQGAGLINTIRSAKPKSGGSAPRISSGGPSYAGQTASSAQPEERGPTTINIVGLRPDDLITGRQAARVLEEYSQDGGVVRVNFESVS